MNREQLIEALEANSFIETNWENRVILTKEAISLARQLAPVEVDENRLINLAQKLISVVHTHKNESSLVEKVLNELRSTPAGWQDIDREALINVIADGTGWEESAIELADDYILPFLNPNFKKPEYADLRTEAKRIFTPAPEPEKKG